MQNSQFTNKKKNSLFKPRNFHGKCIFKYKKLCSNLFVVVEGFIIFFYVYQQFKVSIFRYKICYFSSGKKILKIKFKRKNSTESLQKFLQNFTDQENIQMQEKKNPLSFKKNCSN